VRALLLAAVAALAFAASASAAPQPRYERGLLAGGPGPYHFVADARLTAHARPGFADLRVLDAHGRQVPWRLAPPSEPVADEPVTLLNVGHEGRELVALVDLGSRRVVRSRLDLDVPGHGFVGQVTVLGGDDRTHLRRLSQVAVWDISGAYHSRSTAITFPPSDLRYLELRARGVPGIAGATAAAPEPRSVPARWPIRRITRSEHRHRTVVRMDLGLPLPVEALAVLAATSAYDRPVELDASVDGRRFFPVAGGRIFRYPGARSEPLPVRLRVRALRLRIANGDDRPLGRLAVAALHEPEAILIRGDADGPYTLSYGALRGAPDYDFARLPVAALGRPRPARLGPERLAVPPVRRATPPDYGWALTAGLGVAAIVVGALGVAVMRRKTPAE